MLRIFVSMFMKDTDLQFSFSCISLSGFGIKIKLVSKMELGASLVAQW